MKLKVIEEESESGNNKVKVRMSVKVKKGRWSSAKVQGKSFQMKSAVENKGESVKVDGQFSQTVLVRLGACFTNYLPSSPGELTRINVLGKLSTRQNRGKVSAPKRRNVGKVTNRHF